MTKCINYSKDHVMQRNRGFNYTDLNIPQSDSNSVQVGGYFSPIGLSNIFCDRRHFNEPRSVSYLVQSANDAANRVRTQSPLLLMNSSRWPQENIARPLKSDGNCVSTFPGLPATRVTHESQNDIIANAIRAKECEDIKQYRHSRT